MKNYLKNLQIMPQTKICILTGLLLLIEKKVLLEHYFTPYFRRHNIHSHTKSYLSAAIGIAISQGKISLDDRLADYFPEAIPDHASPLINEIRLRHLLTMSSGFTIRIYP